MRIALLVDDQVENDLDSSVVAALDQVHAVLQRSVGLVNVLVIADIVALFARYQNPMQSPCTIFPLTMSTWGDL